MAFGAKQKGTKFETSIRKDLEAVSVPAQRQPLSGAIAAFPGDVMIDPQGWRLKIECKHHKTISHYDRIEKSREYLDGVLVNTPTGRFYWLDHQTALELVAACYTPGVGLKPISLGGLQLKKHPKVFDGMLKGCDILIVRPNHKEPRWWIGEKLFWELCENAARGSVE